ncbi:MAG TPA: TIM barrel protein [Clostridiaceae bacterium]|nr:TIM barrel protein [Clostridiaceae bacterium]
MRVSETLAISTSWNAVRYHDAESFIEEFESVNITTIELNYNITQRIIDDIMPFLNAGRIRVSSVHNYCPEDMVSEDIKPEMVLSNTDEEYRVMAVAYTKRTLDLSHFLGANAVVIHTGYIKDENNMEDTLRLLFKHKQKGTEEYERIKCMLQEERRRQRSDFVNASGKSIEELSEYIAKKGYNIKLGLENRYYFFDIPTIDEYEDWFSKYSDYPIGLWYDIGHGEVLENLGLVESKKLLEKYKQHLIGMHIHDTTGLTDHSAPGMDRTDFRAFTEYFKLDIIKVLELKSSIKTDEVRNGISYLKKIMEE